YFYDHDGARCNRREPGSGCDAREGFSRGHAILGASPACAATHPSDMAVALAALGATVHTRGSGTGLSGPGGTGGTRAIPLTDFHRLPGDHPEIETVLEPGELITAVEIPPLPLAANSAYRKVRDRASYAFALASVAAAVEVTDGVVRDVRLALGGVATTPWRAWRAEEALRGRPATAESFRAAARAELAAARPLQDNQFKIDLTERIIVALLGQLTGAEA
ncbi:MAG: FAD binding domain-containing protein, partial [Nocardiopsaceae bacterium]|nr:FAD binding domain-containing protein [Nocardiopsaceae bacterium]